MDLRPVLDILNHLDTLSPEEQRDKRSLLLGACLIPAPIPYSR